MGGVPCSTLHLPDPAPDRSLEDFRSPAEAGENGLSGEVLEKAIIAPIPR
jgi:hypothetical protein